MGVITRMEIQWRHTSFCQISLHCSYPAQCPRGLYCLRYSQKNGRMCSSVTACSIRHRIVSFKQQVRPILLKMNPTKPIFWGSLLQDPRYILNIPCHCYGRIVHNFKSSASKHCWEIKFKDQGTKKSQHTTF